MVDSQTLNRLFELAESAPIDVITESELAVLFTDNNASHDIDSYLSANSIPTIESALDWLFS